MNATVLHCLILLVLSPSSFALQDGGHTLFDSYYPLIKTDTFIRGVSVSVALDGSSTLVLRNHEREAPSDAWLDSSFSYGSSLPISTLASRTADDFFIAGRTKSGTDVVERWTVNPVAGGYRTTKAVYSGPPAQPFQSATMITQVYELTFVPPLSRAQPTIKRSEAFSGNVNGIDVLAADPDGRYLLMVADEKLLKLPLQSGAGVLGAVEVLYDSQGIPELATAAPNLQVMHHSALGRTYTLLGSVAGLPTERVLFIDSDNNGVFETVASYTPLEYDSSGIPGGWIDDFYQY